MRPSLGPLVFAHGLSTFVLPVRQEVRLPYDAEAVRLQLLLIGPHLRFRQTLAMDVAQGRTVGSLDRLIDHMRGPPFEGIRRDEVSERNPSKEREIRVPRDVMPASRPMAIGASSGSSASRTRAMAREAARSAHSFS